MDRERTVWLAMAMVGCALAVLAVTLSFVGILGGGAVFLLGEGPSSNRMLGGVLVAIGGVVLLPITVTMWVSLVRLLKGPPRGARTMITCLSTFGSFLLMVFGPVTLRSGNLAGPVIVALLGFGSLGVAALLAYAVAPAPADAR